MAVGSWGRPGRDTRAGAGGPVFPASHPGQDAHPWALLPHPDPPPLSRISALASSHSALPARDHLLLSRLASVTWLGKKLRLDHLVFVFFSGHHHQFTPTLCLAFQAPTIQPCLPSQPHHPALRPHSALPRCPPPRTSRSLYFA